MPPRPLPPRPPGRRVLPGLVGRAGLLVLALLGASACGARETPVTGTLEDDPQVGRAHLVVEGTPREMGRAQGRLLRARIHAFHEAWQRALVARDGDLLSPASKARRRELLGLLEPARRTLPESALQELEGIAEGSGLPLPTLLLSEMLTDLLRFQAEPGPLLEAAAFPVSPRSGRGAALRFTGALGETLRPHLVWITRRGRQDAPAVTVLAWPGSLGGLLATRADGLAALAGEVPLEAGRQGLAGVPFRLALRLAVEQATDVASLRARLARTTAHQVLIVDLERGTGERLLSALAGEEPEPLDRWPSANALVGDGDGLVARHDGVTTVATTLASKPVRVP